MGATGAKIDLQAHLAKLRKAKDEAPQVIDDAIIYWGSIADKKYLPQLKGCVGSYTTYVRTESITALTQVAMYCSQKKVYKVVSSSPSLLAKLLHWDKRAAPSFSDYAGSYFTIKPFKEGEPEIEVVFIQPLKRLVTVTYEGFMTSRQVTKLTNPKKWYKPTEFSWDMLKMENEEAMFATMQDCFLVSIDIETLREDAQIRCLSYTGFWYDEDGGISSLSLVLPLDGLWALGTMRKWNQNLSAPKVMQGGMYDIAYLSRYNAPVHNYLYDTANLFHCWYSELPKDLGFLNSFFIREAVYWKDLAETNDLYEYYKYNALDTWGTGNCWLAMLLEAPEYAIQNYLLEFPLIFPCHLCEMTGIERDMDRLALATKEQDDIIAEGNASLNAMLAIPQGEQFNVNSPPQMKALLKLLGCGDFKSTDAKHLEKARFRHPFNARIINTVSKVRKARKLVSTYLTAGKEFNRQDGTGNRVLFSLKPHGTDSSRLASREHHFWCGLQIQNIPRTKDVKQTLRADEGFALCEVDLEQAESRDTAYISGDKRLIVNVEDSPDFHSANAALFFGVPFEKIYDIATQSVIDKPLRTLAKPVNHGANYNMGAYVLIDTMGEENIIKAKTLLGLNKFWGYVQIAEYLLEQFHKGYPNIKKVFYEGVKEEIAFTHKLVSRAIHYPVDTVDKYDEEYEANGGAWTRYCFGNPSKSKPHLNTYIAHPPQSLNAQTLNKGFLKVFHEIAIHPEYSNNFKLLAQIHDSILFQYRLGHEYLCDMVQERLEIPVRIRAYDKKVRTFIVPASAKKGNADAGEPALYWSETE